MTTPSTQFGTLVKCSYEVLIGVKLEGLDGLLRSGFGKFHLEKIPIQVCLDHENKSIINGNTNTIIRENFVRRLNEWV